MKSIMILVVLFGLGLHADRVKKTVTVCSEEATITELREYAKTHSIDKVKGGVELELWLMSHNCKIIDNKTEIEVLDYTGKKNQILKIRLKKTGDIVYGMNKGIQIEQPGQKNVIYKF